MKICVSKFKKSINESNFTDKQILLIWDFYVTKSISHSASQGRKASDYGINRLEINDLMEIAGITKDNAKFLLANSMPNTLKKLDFIYSQKDNIDVEIDVDTPRIAFITPFTIADNDHPKAVKNVSRVASLFTHIRNAFAHGNTYFFDNGNVLLEDKDARTTTAMILIKQQTLLDWVAFVDKKEIYYKHSELLDT